LSAALFRSEPAFSLASAIPIMSCLNRDPDRPTAS
jgi:hypothetical protein